MSVQMFEITWSPLRIWSVAIATSDDHCEILKKAGRQDTCIAEPLASLTSPFKNGFVSVQHWEYHQMFYQIGNRPAVSSSFLLLPPLPSSSSPSCSSSPSSPSFSSTSVALLLHYFCRWYDAVPAPCPCPLRLLQRGCRPWWLCNNNNNNSNNEKSY